MPRSSRGPGDAIVHSTPARSEKRRRVREMRRAVRGSATRVCGSPAVDRGRPDDGVGAGRSGSGRRVRAPALPAVGRTRSGSCDGIPVPAAYRGLVIGGSASTCVVPDGDIATAITDRDRQGTSRRRRVLAIRGVHGTTRCDRQRPPGSRAVDRGEVSHTRTDIGGPRTARCGVDNRCAPGGRGSESVP